MHKREVRSENTVSCNSKVTDAAITRDRKQQDFHGGRANVVVVVVSLCAVVSWARGGRLSVAAQCPRTRRASLLTHFLYDRLQLRDGRKAA